MSHCYCRIVFSGRDMCAHAGRSVADYKPAILLTSVHGGYVDIEIDGLTDADTHAIKAILDAAIARAADKPTPVLEAAE